MAAATSPCAAEVRLDVAGQAREALGRLIVRVEVANHGDAAAHGLEVEAELLGETARATLAAPLAAGATQAVEMAFPAEVPRPGVHGVSLHLRYAPEGTPGSASAASQRAYLLLALGADPAPPVHVDVPDARLARYAEVPVRLESADGRPHRVRLRVLTPQGVNAVEPETTVEVPGGGAVIAPLRLVRAGARPGARAGLVLLASDVDGPLERTAAATAVVEVDPPPAPWLPRARTPLLAAALVLLAAAAGAEWWWFRSHPA